MTDTVVIADNGEVTTGYRFSWGLAIAGGVAATAVTFFLLTLGSGFGLLLVNPLKHSGASLPAFLTGGAIYFLAAQAFGFAVGGHLTGRLLGPQLESRIQEDFRAAAHGLIAWAVAILATLSIVVLAGLTAVGSGATTAALYGATTPHAEVTSTAYLVDVLFRPQSETRSDATSTLMVARAEASRILDAGPARGEQIAPEDRARLTILVSREAAIPLGQAAERIDRMQSNIQAKTKHAADIARKTASFAALWLAIAMLFGVIVSMSSAMLARSEDDRDALASRANVNGNAAAYGR